VTESQTDFYGPVISLTISFPAIIVTLVIIGIFLLLKRQEDTIPEPLSLLCYNESDTNLTLPQGCRKIYFSSADASSENPIILDRYTYEAGKAIDEDPESSWQEGDLSGDGSNEWLKLSFNSSQNVRYIKLKLGNWRENYSSDSVPYARYIENNTPTILAVVINNSESEYLVSFSPEREDHYIVFNKPCSIKSITFIIKSVKAGTTSNDACISDVSAYG